jgi:hypothetical protein
MVHFQAKIKQFGQFLEGLEMEKFCICYGHWECINVIWYFYGNVVI